MNYADAVLHIRIKRTLKNKLLILYRNECSLSVTLCFGALTSEHTVFRDFQKD